MTDPILYWNEAALEANRVSHTNGRGEQTGPTLSSRALAMVHLAMYDAYVGTEPGSGLDRYDASVTLPTTPASSAAAVAAAAHAVLSHLFPSQKTYFDAHHRRQGIADAHAAAGHAFGLQVAGNIIKTRKDDPDASDTGYSGATHRGAHRPDPDNPAQGYHAPFYGARSHCFATTVRHSLDAPPALDSAEYLAALRQVRAKGIAPELLATVPSGASPRTPLETLIGIYWGYDGAAGLGTPPRLYNQIVRQVAVARGNSPAENARLFALINAAMGDAGILCWEQKYIHDFWRPVIGVREQDSTMGLAATGGAAFSPDCDPAWLPLGAPATNSNGAKNFTPPFPAYPSGHATFGAAALHAARLFYNTPHLGADTLLNAPFVSEEYDGDNRDRAGTVRPRHARSFAGGLWDMIVENGLSRVFLGVHWVFDAFAVDANGGPDLARKVGGVRLGLDIAQDIFASGLKRSTV